MIPVERRLPVKLTLPLVAVAATALVLTGCSSNNDDSAASTSSSAASSSAAATTSDLSSTGATVPTADDLKFTLTQISDPAVTVAAKSTLIAKGTERTAQLEQLNAGLANYPLSYDVENVQSDATSATADVAITSPHGAAPAMPMGWDITGPNEYVLNETSTCAILGMARIQC